MGGEDIRNARIELGRRWSPDGEPLTAKELARALGLSEQSGHNHIYKMESGKAEVSTTLAILIRLYLGGAVPPDDVVIFTDRRSLGGRRISDTKPAS